MKTVSLKLPPALDIALSGIASTRGVSKSFLIREALEQWLRQRGAGTTGQSVGALAADLAGCIDGPGDLSYNPAHLHDFGR